jgi:hypothetical protein
MAASVYSRSIEHTNDELLTAKLTAVAFNNLHADIEVAASSTIRMLGSSWWCRWSTA